MTDTDLLKKIIGKKGVAQETIMHYLHIPVDKLYNKIDSKKEFRASEIFGLTVMLQLDCGLVDKIFFGK